MTDMMGIAVSGLRAAEGRAVTAAANLVNARSGAPAPAAGEAYAGYTPRTAEPVSQAGGGVDLVSRPVDPAYVLLPAGSGGNEAVPPNEAVPNVDETTEIMAMKSAEQAYKANASLIRTAEAMGRTLLDVLG